MRDRMRELWDGAVPVGVPCPQADPAAVKRRVNAALNAVPSERRAYMRQKLRFAAAVAAIAALLAGSALAVAGQWNVLDFFYEGDTAPAVEYVNNQAYSVSDDNYTLSVTSSVADTRSAYLLVTVEAKNDAARATLMADDFRNIDTFFVRVLEDETAEPEPTPEVDGPCAEVPSATGSFGTGEEEHLRTDTSRTFTIHIQPLSAAANGVRLRLGVMSEDDYVELPLDPLEPIGLEINTEGEGRGTGSHIEGGPVTLERVSLSPLSLRLDYSYRQEVGKPFPLLFFRMADDSLRTWGQMMDNDGSGSSYSKDGVVSSSRDCQFRSVIELSQLDAVIFDGMAYPLDGGRPETVEVDPTLYPFQIPLMNRLSEDSGYSVPVRALCEGLGVDCVWDNDTQTATMTYRDVTISLTWGSATALVDGQPVEMYAAPNVQDGKLAADYRIFTDTWQLDMSAAYDDWPSDNAQRVAWLVIP